MPAVPGSSKSGAGSPTWGPLAIPARLRAWPSPWIEEHAAGLAARAERDLEALVAISSPSGDAAAAEEVVAVATALAPDDAEVDARPLLVQRARRRPRPARDRRRDAPAAARRAPRHRRRARRARAAAAHRAADARLGNDRHEVRRRAVARAAARAERPSRSWGRRRCCSSTTRSGGRSRSRTCRRFEGFDACLCFEAGEHDPDGQDAVVVRRKAAGSIRVHAHGRAAHSGSAPDKGVNALLALADVASIVAGLPRPAGPEPADRGPDDPEQRRGPERGPRGR